MMKWNDTAPSTSTLRKSMHSSLCAAIIADIVDNWRWEYALELQSSINFKCSRRRIKKGANTRVEMKPTSGTEEETKETTACERKSGQMDNILLSLIKAMIQARIPN